MGQHLPAMTCADLCVPKTISEFLRWQNRLSWRNGGADCFVLAVLALPIKSKNRLEAEDAYFDIS